MKCVSIDVSLRLHGQCVSMNGVRDQDAYEVSLEQDLTILFLDVILKQTSRKWRWNRTINQGVKDGNH